MEKKPVLSISMLVSNNRRDTIEKCMESLVPLMQAVSSELIIVDTGCTDGSVDIARKYADKVVQFTWCKDFSAARNAGLRECTGEWFLYLDDDEWFEDVSEIIDFLKGDEKNHCDSLWYLQRNYDNFEGTAYGDTYVGRMVKLTPETKFCGKIHEWLSPLPKMIKKVNTYVHHYGYVYRTEEDRLKHLERNLTLEEEAVRENPKDIRMCCQLVQEYRAARRYEDAEAFAQETLKNTEYGVNNSFVQYLMLVIPRIYGEQERYREAIEAYEKLESTSVLMHQTRLGLYYEKALTYGYLKENENLIRTYLRYLKELTVVPKVGDPVEHPVMDFIQYQSDFFAQRAVEFSVKNLITGNLYSYAEEVYGWIDWKKTAQPKEMLMGLFQCYGETGIVALFAKHFPVLLAMPEMQEQVYGGVQAYYDGYPERRDAFLADLESLHIQSGNFPFFHLLYTESKGITTEQDIKDYYKKSDRKYDEEVARLLLGKAEQKLVTVSEQKCFGTIAGVMKEYIAWAKAYADAVYGPEAWTKEELVGTEERPEVPAELRFSHCMEHVLEAEDGAVFAAGVKQALAQNPAMLPAVRALLEEREVFVLAKQLKATAKAQLSAGQTEEAMAILSELATMLPEDADVKEMLRRI